MHGGKVVIGLRADEGISAGYRRLRGYWRANESLPAMHEKFLHVMPFHGSALYKYTSIPKHAEFAQP